MLAVAWSLWARPANADHVQIGLQYARVAGAESCASEEELRAAVAERLGYDPFLSRGHLDAIIVRIRRVSAHLEGTIERRDSSRRTTSRAQTISTENADCGELTSALAVGIAIAIDPMNVPAFESSTLGGPSCSSTDSKRGRRARAGTASDRQSAVGACAS